MATETKLTVYELVVEMKLLERRLTLYEEKYGVLSEDFHRALTAGELSRYDEFDETRTDFSRWKGIYETWLRRKQAYDEEVKNYDEPTLRRDPIVAEVRAAREALYAAAGHDIHEFCQRLHEKQNRTEHLLKVAD